MKKTAGLLLAGLALGLIQPISEVVSPEARSQSVAQAAVVKATPVTGQYGTVTWRLTADGTLHLGAGQLGEPTNLIANTGQLATQIVLAQGGTPTAATTQAAADQVTSVVLDGPVKAPEDATGLFAQLRNVTAYKNLAQLDTSETTTMKTMFLVNDFDGSPTSLDVSHFDTSKVTNMDFMFYGLSQLTQLDVSHWDTGNVTSLMSTFRGDESLTTLDFAAGTFASLSNVMYAFGGAGVQTIRLPKFAPPSTFSGFYMFTNASELSTLTLGPATILGASTGLTTPKANDTYTGSWQAVGDGTAQNPLGEKFATGSAVAAQYNQADKPSAVETYVWEPVDRVIEPPVVEPPVVTPPDNTAAPVSVRYVDDKQQTLTSDRTLTGQLGDTYTAEQLTFDGYHLAKIEGAKTGTFSKSAQTVTFHYAPDLATGGDGATVVPVNGVVYATKKIGLYRTKTFTKQSRQFFYAKQSRTQRPMFVVTGYATSKNGHRRYQVRDVNHHSKTAGKTGYITANKAYVSSAYYAKRQAKIKVINAQGINSYRQVALKGKVKHYHKGQVLKVKKIVNYRKTTRFVLTNGQYVTANKKLVIAE